MVRCLRHCRPLIATGGILVAATFLVGCGDDAPDPAAKARVEAKRSYQGQAERACRAVPSLRVEASPATTGATAARARRAAARQLDTLRRLGAPEDDRRALERYFQALEQLVRDLPAVERAARGNDPGALRATVQRAAASQGRSGKLAREYGLARCS